MADPTLRTCYNCNMKFRKGYGEKYCPTCKRIQLRESLRETEKLFIIKQIYNIQ